MYQPLEAAHAKVGRAVKDLEALRDDAERFLEGNPYFIAVEFDGETGWHSAVAQVAEEPPPRLSVLVGSVAYQLLSALNLLTWRLAVRKLGARATEAVKNEIQFPVAFSPNHFANLKLVKNAHVSKQALTVLERLQPYNGHHGPTGARHHPLALIKELADSDKHRVLASAYGRMEMAGVKFEWDAPASDPHVRRVARRSRTIKAGAHLARIRFDIGNQQANVRVNPQPTLEILFDSDNWAISLYDLGNCIAATFVCLDAIETLFPGA